MKIESCDNFQKMSFRNRYVIAGANGLNNLTVPVVGGREQKTLMREIKIDHTQGWQMKHWRSLTSAYNKAPFFEHYSGELQQLIFSTEESLFNFNLEILWWLLNKLGFNILLHFTSQYEEQPNAEDYRDKILPKNFQGDKQDWTPKYSQVFEERLGFQPNLSILDLLFCEGPNAKQLLERSVK